MEFGLSQDQRLMQESLRSALTRACTMQQVRDAAQHGTAFDADVWAAVRELGLPALLVPEAHGGLELSLLVAALAAQELGRVAAPSPFLGSCVLAPLALRHAGTNEQQARWLPAIARGELVVGVAVAEALGSVRDGAGVQVSAEGRMHGSALFVIDGAQAGAYVVADRAGGLHWVDAQAIGVECQPLPGTDATRPLVELRFEGARSERLAGGGGAALERLRDAASVLLAADALGAGWTMLERAVAYAHERRQFGRQIASFQAVKHLCAEMAAELEITQALVWYAAYAIDHLPEEAALAAAHAKALLADVGRFVARTATEVHGGMGITDELGLHFWFKRIDLDRQLYGGPEKARRHAAVLQGLIPPQRGRDVAALA